MTSSEITQSKNKAYQKQKHKKQKKTLISIKLFVMGLHI